MNNRIKLIHGFLALIFSAAIIYGCTETKELQKTNSKNESAGSLYNAASNTGQKNDLSLNESKLEWTATKVTGKHSGTVEFVNGNIYMEDNTLTGGNFEIDFKSIKVLDIKDAEMNAKLTGHLKSPDFFSADEFPSGKFVLTSIKSISENNFEVKGNLTIKNITKEINFPVKINTEAKRITATADFNIDRTLWDVKYRSGKFYENLGDKLISDDFNIKLNLVFSKS